MIFVTVGAQMPFDRLIRALDAWAGKSGQQDIYAQIGIADYKPQNMEWIRFIEPKEFRRIVKDSEAIVAHAGIGTIITAMELRKPILVMPRRGDLRETRNDHQIATAKRFEEQGRVAVAYDERILLEKIDALSNLKPCKSINHGASTELIERLRIFMDSI